MTELETLPGEKELPDDDSEQPDEPVITPPDEEPKTDEPEE